MTLHLDICISLDDDYYENKIYALFTCYLVYVDSNVIVICHHGGCAHHISLG